jgi:23S rRNA (cytidine1920-2'-O)/16S rRNA (cytidine1409-2'-O)-methyltransferase
MPKQRADILLVQRGFVESRSLAQRLVMAGQVRAGGQLVPKPSTMLAVDATLEVDEGPRYVSRGGEKLAAALETFPLSIEGATCADVGSSTGGFTDCLLQSGAVRVYAIDVGRGQLHWKLRHDERVIVMEETNARMLEALPESVDLVTVDASFISLKVLLPGLKGWLRPDGQLIALIKPQFEAGREATNRGKGVIRDPNIHRTVLQDVLRFAALAGLASRGLIRSPLRGPKGNLEFLLWLTLDGESADFNALVSKVLPEGV